jgi:hypothetical protein
VLKKISRNFSKHPTILSHQSKIKNISQKRSIYHAGAALGGENEREGLANFQIFYLEGPGRSVKSKTKTHLPKTALLIRRDDEKVTRETRSTQQEKFA